jgi:hypothetical protein
MVLINFLLYVFYIYLSIFLALLLLLIFLYVLREYYIAIRNDYRNIF